MTPYTKAAQDKTLHGISPPSPLFGRRHKAFRTRVNVETRAETYVPQRRHQDDEQDGHGPGKVDGACKNVEQPREADQAGKRQNEVARDADDQRHGRRARDAEAVDDDGGHVEEERGEGLGATTAQVSPHVRFSFLDGRTTGKVSSRTPSQRETASPGLHRRSDLIHQASTAMMTPGRSAETRRIVLYTLSERLRALRSGVRS